MRARPGGVPRFELAAFDLDGTVLQRGVGISPRTAAAVGRLRGRGTRIVVATGRRFEGTREHAAALGLRSRDPIVCYGGAMVRRLDGETLLHRTLPRDSSLAFLDWAAGRNLHARVFTDGRIALGPAPPYAAGHLRRPAGPGVLAVDSPAEWLAEAGGGPTKLAVADAPERIEAWLDGARGAFAGSLLLTRSHPDYVEVTSPENTKSAALAFLCERWGIEPRRLIAFGDAENDIDMLRFAGRGVAVGPMTGAVREAADDLAPPARDDGVALYLEKLLGGP